MSANDAESIQIIVVETPTPDSSTDDFQKPNPEFQDPDDPDLHALPKLPNDGDPWTTLLAPELEADTVRCNAWKEEVQTLLIFAGLFSSVVTAFVIESYKFLHPDPNDAIIGLLFQIANSSNNTSSPQSVDPRFTPFSRSSSSVRINVFWFLSLILSLTTVLIGTIALQWLREHQSYVGYSEKEKVAILHMRLEAVEAWHIPQVFAALPLLLQSALVLFLAGLIDFSLPLGPELTIPVAIIIGLTLLFLAATTILPTLQGLSFLCGLYPRKSLSTPCPFKSPQSHALRMLVAIILRTFFHIFPLPHVSAIYRGKPIIINRPLLMPDHLVPSAYDVWYQQTWLTFDLKWLSLRDACHQRMVDCDPHLYWHRTFWQNKFPLSDATQYLVKAARQTPSAKHTEPFLVALVHCFQQLSESLWTNSYFGRNDRRNNYFEQLCSRKSCSIAKFLLHGGNYQFARFENDDPQTKYTSQNIKEHIILLAEYQLNLWTRILQFTSHTAPLTSAGVDDSYLLNLTVLNRDQVYLMIYGHHSERQALATATVLSALFKLAASYHNSQLLAHKQMAGIIGHLAYITYRCLAQTDTSPGQHTLQDVDQFIKIFEFIGNHLNSRLSDSLSSSQEISRDALFYLSAIFLSELLGRRNFQNAFESKGKDSAWGQALKSSHHALYQMWTSVPQIDAIEMQLKDDNDYMFSDIWWHELFKNISEEPMRSVALEENLINSHSGGFPSPSSEVASNAEDQTSAVIEPWVTFPIVISPDALPEVNNVHQLASTKLDSYSRPEASRGESLSTESPSMVDDRVEPPAPSATAIIQNHHTMTPEKPDTVDDFAPSPSRPPSDGPREFPPLIDDRIALVTAPADISQYPPPHNIVESDRTAPQSAIEMTHSTHNDDDVELEWATKMASSRSDEQDLLVGHLQSSEHHVVIDVGAPMNIRAGAN